MTPAIVAIGHWKSTMMSCDGGRTWKGYRSNDNNVRCWSASSGNIDCDHQASSGMGVTWGPRGFMATYGWGQPGQVELSRNGTNWSVVQSGNTWAGVAYGNNYYILNERNPLRSSDAAQWGSGGYINFRPWNARRIHFVPQGGGVFISTANSSGDHDLMISKDNGVSFRRPTGLPSGCGEGELAYGGQRIVLLSQNLCVSQDAGETWTSHSRPASGPIVYGNNEFRIYGAGVVYRSTTGTSWTQTNLTINGAPANGQDIGELVAYHPDTASYASIQQYWGRWYEYTQYFHSTDGIAWTRLNKAAGAAPQSPHPMRRIAIGYLENCN